MDAKEIKDDDNFLLAMLLVLSIVPLVIYNGFIFSKMWLWFIVPLGMQTITITHSIGLVLFMNLFIKNHKTKDGEGKLSKALEALFVGFFSSTFILGVGYIIKEIMTP